MDSEPGSVAGLGWCGHYGDLVVRGTKWQLNVPRFQCFRHEKEGGKRGRGAALVIRESIMVTPREDILQVYPLR